MRDQTWRNDAACKGRGHLFFYEASNSREGQAAIAKAAAICATCPVLEDCRDWLAHDPQPPVAQSVVAGLGEAGQIAFRKTYRADRAEAKAAVRPPCGTRLAWERHQRLGETCLYCEHWSTTRKMRHGQLRSQAVS